MQFLAIMQVYINTSKNNDTWKGLSNPCTMHIDLTPIFGQRRNAQAGIGFSMVLEKISTQLVREHRQYFVRPILPVFAMQN